MYRLTDTAQSPEMTSLGLNTKMCRCTRVRKLLSYAKVSTTPTARSGPSLLLNKNILLEAFDTGKTDHEADNTSEPCSPTHRSSTSSIFEKVMLLFSTIDSCPPMQEMLALTLIVAGGKAVEVAYHFREAFQRYTSVSATGSGGQRSGVRYATRSMLMMADYCRELGHYGEANYALMKAHFQVCAASEPCRALN